MDRIFDKSEIENLCVRIKEILKESKEYMNEMEKEAKKAKRAFDSVPEYVKDNRVQVEADNLLNAISKIDLDTFFRKLKDYQKRACTDIPSQDKKYQKQTEQLKNQVEGLMRAAVHMRDFLVDTPLTTDQKSFQAALKVASLEWNEVMKDAVVTVNNILRNIKGMNIKSQIFSKDPVNLSTGNFIYDSTDLEIMGSTSFIFRRFYNAINDRSGVLGKDWNHNYEIFIETKGEERILVLEEGKEERFVLTSENNYTGVYNDALILHKTEEGYQYRTEEDVVFCFNEDGSCRSKEYPDGSICFFFYEENRLTKIEKNTGEYFSFKYREEGYLESIKDHSGRQVKYQMNGDRLISVCTPNGHCYRYEYNLNGKLESVQNAREIVVVENTYDEKMRTVLQKFPDGGKMSYKYKDEARAVVLTERNGSEVTYVHDDRYRDIKHIYSDGEEKFIYNKRNQKTMIIDKLGNMTQFAYDENGNLTRVINALGKKTEIRYNKRNKPISVIVNGRQEEKNEYDKKGRLILTEDALGNQYKIQYDESGRPEKMEQPDGSQVRLFYDSYGNIIQLIDASGVVSKYEYDILNRVTRSIDGNGNETRYTYDAEDNLTCITNMEGLERQYRYNESGNLIQVIDFDGSVIKQEYNALNMLSKVTDQLGRETKFTYDVMWNLARITEPNGAKTTYLYNEHNRLGRIRNANGDVIRYEYDVNGNLIKETDEEGNVTRFSYDAMKRLTRVEGPEKVQMNYHYDEWGNLIKVIDALENEVYFMYDANGNLIKETGPCGEKRIYTYTKLGEVESITDEADRKTCYIYELGGKLTKIIHPDENTESYTYDKGGRVISYIGRNGYEFTYTYNSLDQVIAIKGSEGDERYYSYDSTGNVILTTDAIGNKTEYEYSLTGQLTKVRDALGNETEYRYDVCDRLIEVCQYGEDIAKDGSKLDDEYQKAEELNNMGKICHVTKYERDAMGNILSVKDALGQTEHYTYNKKSELVGKIDKEGYLTKYGYTAHGDVKQVEYADGRRVKFSYNPLRYLEQVEDWIGITKIETDPNGRTKKVIYPDLKEVRYSYGTTGEKLSLTYPDGRRVDYKYDKFLRLSQLKEGENITSYRYDERSFLKEKELPSGIKTTYAYDARGMLTGLSHIDCNGILDFYEHTYDRNGNRIQTKKERRDLFEESGIYDYEYDQMGRLNRVSKNGQDLRSYKYDAFGNRISKKEGNKQTKYEYNVLNQLITKKYEENEISYSYDKRGNVSNIHRNGKLTNQYHYGALNRLEMAENHEIGRASVYKYNGLGHRVGERIKRPNEATLDPINKIKKEGLTPEQKVDYLIDMTRDYHNLLQESEGKQIKTYIWDGFASSVIEEGGIESTYFYLNDELGSPVRFTGKQGHVEESYGYDEFGTDIYKSHGLQPFGYTGYRRDKVSDTYYAQAREYLPDEGRFAGTDQIKGIQSFPQSLNEYSYCWNNPLCYVDPNGLWVHIAIGALVGGIVNTAVSVGISVASGEEITTRKVVAAFIGGGVTGAITAVNPSTIVAADAAGAVVESLINDIGVKPPLEVVKNAVINGVTSAAFSWAGGKIASKIKSSKIVGKIKNSKVVTAIKNSKPVNAIKNSKLGVSFNKIIKDMKKEVKVRNTSYKGQMTRARNAWKNGKIIKLTYKTLRNGIIGELPGAIKKALIQTLPESLSKQGLSYMLDEVYELACI